MFLLVKGARTGLFKGEAQDHKHTAEIEVVSWSWGMQGRPSLGDGRATGKATINELRIVKRVDAASTGLMSALRTNEPIKEATLTVRKAGKGQLEFLKIKIENGRVTSLTVEGGDSSGGADVVERLSFAFNKISVEYTKQGSDGLGMGTSVFADEWSEAQ